MSERGKKAAGCLLLLACFLLCLLPFLMNGRDLTQRYRAGDNVSVPIVPTETETGGIIRLNAADAEELQELPGIGETYSALIVSERNEHGPFYYPEDLLSVKGIGPKTLQKFRGLLDLSLEEGGE